MYADRLQAAQSCLRVMVVDDNADAAQMLALLLESVGHQVVIAHGSRRALELAGNPDGGPCTAFCHGRKASCIRGMPR